MITKENGITLVSLVITIGVMLIIAATVVPVTYERFEINNLNKMITDIELLKDKVSNYYLKYGVLPILRTNGAEVRYTYKTLSFEESSTIYYILDLSAMDGISLNYGRKGFEKPNKSDDVYVISKDSNIIYYPKGVEMDGEKYHSLKEGNNINDNLPPTNPKINIISGTTNEDGVYITPVEVEIIPGKDNWSGMQKTEYSIDNGSTWYSLGNSSNVYTLENDGSHTIIVKSYDKNNNQSSDTLTIEIEIEQEDIHTHTLDDGTVTKVATCTEKGTMTYECTVEGCDYTETSQIPALGHNYEEIININKLTSDSNPICTEDREFYKTCSRCDVKDETFIVPASNGHKLEFGVAPEAPNNGTYIINGKVSHIELAVCKNKACEVGHIKEYWHDENIYYDDESEMWRNHCIDGCYTDFKFCESNTEYEGILNEQWDQSDQDPDRGYINDWDYVYQTVMKTTISLISMDSDENFTKEEIVQFLSKKPGHWESEIWYPICSYFSGNI